MAEGESVQPVECYRFEMEGIGVRNYTTFGRTFTAEGIVYNRMSGLSRSAIGIVTSQDKYDLSISLPARAELAMRLAYFETPPKTKLIFRRYDMNVPSTPTMRFEAGLGGATISGNVCTLKFPDSLSSAVQGTVGKYRLQTMCNHRFGDHRCQRDISALSASYSGSLVSFLPTDYNYPGGSGSFIFGFAPPTPEGFSIEDVWKGASVHVQTASRNEYFTCISCHINVSGLSFSMRVPRYFPIPDLAAGAISIKPGCDRSFEMCGNYDNTDRFGGFPSVPTEHGNPFRVRLGYRRR